LALKGFNEAELDETNPDQAMIFHHRFAETIWPDDTPEESWFEHEKYWNLVSLDRNAVNYSYKAMSFVSALFSGASYLGEESTEYSLDGNGLPPAYRHLLLLDRQGNTVHVLWASSASSQTVTFEPKQGCQGTLYFQFQGTGQDTWGFRRQEHFMAGSGGFVLELPGSSSPDRGGSNSAFEGWTMVGGPVYILVETNESCTTSAPTGSADLVCTNGRVVGTALLGYDESAGLDTLTAACSPAVTYDLSWTQPGRCRVVLIIVLYVSPPAAFPTA